MKDAASNILVMTGLVLFVMAAVALRRHRKPRRRSRVHFHTESGALGAGVSLGVCGAGTALAPPQEQAVHVSTTPSTTEYYAQSAAPRHAAPRKSTTTTTLPTTTTTAPIAAKQVALRGAAY